jgi:prepilin-type N-terminal cleavage/methylation domain-containing protein
VLSDVAVRARRGLTLVELVAALVVAGTVLAVIAGISVRQQRTVAALMNDAALAGQLRDAASMLPMDVRGADVRAGDLREASDTSVEVRETIASAVICDTLGSSVLLAPQIAGATTFAGSIAPIQIGDTTWIFTPGDSSHAWRPYRVTSVGSSRAGDCLARAPRLVGPALAAARTRLSLDSAPEPFTIVGLPTRITRPIRYSVYRSSDGNWYLGARDWNSGSNRFNTIQPIAGPFQAPAAGTPVFRWFDTTGAVLPTPVDAGDRVALLRVALRGQTKGSDRILGSAQNTGPRRDSVSISVSVRNRP